MDGSKSVGFIESIILGIALSINNLAEQEIDDMQGHLHRLEDDFEKFRNEYKSDMAELKKLLSK